MGKKTMVWYRGEINSLRCWSEKLGINYSTLKSRHRKGWSIERMLNPKLEVKTSGGHLHKELGYYFDGNNGKVELRHRKIAENILGKPLPPKACIHHVDGNGANNEHSNLVVCQDRAYHFLLHQRQRAYDASGNAGWLKCLYCKEYDNPQNMYVLKTKRAAHHSMCVNKYKRDRRIMRNGRGK